MKLKNKDVGMAAPTICGGLIMPHCTPNELKMVKKPKKRSTKKAIFVIYFL